MFPQYIRSLLFHYPLLSINFLSSKVVANIVLHCCTLSVHEDFYYGHVFNSWLFDVIYWYLAKVSSVSNNPILSFRTDSIGNLWTNLRAFVPTFCCVFRTCSAYCNEFIFMGCYLQYYSIMSYRCTGRRKCEYKFSDKSTN